MNAKLDPKGGAVIVIKRSATRSSTSGRRRFGRPSRTPGFLHRGDHFSKSSEVGAKLLKEKLKANPKLVLVFGVDGLSTSACRSVMAELIPDRLFVQAAFPAESNYSDMIRVGDWAAVAGFIPNRVIRKAIATAVSVSQGKDVPRRVEVPVEVHDSDEKSTTPQSPAYYKSREGVRKKEGP